MHEGHNNYTQRIYNIYVRIEQKTEVYEDLYWNRIYRK